MLNIFLKFSLILCLEQEPNNFINCHYCLSDCILDGETVSWCYEDWKDRKKPTRENYCSEK